MEGELILSEVKVVESLKNVGCRHVEGGANT